MPDIKARLRKALGNLVEVPAGTARLGKGDGSGTIIANYQQRTVWYFDSVTSQTPSTAPLAQGLFLQAFNRAELEGTRIRLGYPPYKSNVLHILGFDSGEGLTAVGGITPNEQLLAKVITVDVGSLINFRVAPQSTPDLTVHVNPCYYLDSTGALNFFGGDDFDLTSLIGALSSGEHQMVLIALDNIVGGLVEFTSTAEAGGLADKDLFDSTTIVTDMTLDAGSIPLGAVHIYDGQTEVIEDDIYRTADPRVIFDATGGGGSSDSALFLAWRGFR